MSFPGLVVVGLSLLIVADGFPNAAQAEDAKGKADKHAENEHEVLVRQLVKRGDDALAKDAKSALAFNAYKFANKYAPKDAAIAAKLKKSEAPKFSVVAASDRFVEMMRMSHVESLKNWTPKNGIAAEVAELRILLIEDLVGDMSAGSAGVTGGSSKLKFFLHKPKVAFDKIKQQLGKPDAEMKHSGGDYSSTYGRIRLNVAKSGEVAGVVFISY